MFESSWFSGGLEKTLFKSVGIRRKLSDLYLRVSDTFREHPTGRGSWVRGTGGQYHWSSGALSLSSCCVGRKNKRTNLRGLSLAAIIVHTFWPCQGPHDLKNMVTEQENAPPRCRIGAVTEDQEVRTCGHNLLQVTAPFFQELAGTPGRHGGTAPTLKGAGRHIGERLRSPISTATK